MPPGGFGGPHQRFESVAHLPAPGGEPDAVFEGLLFLVGGGIAVQVLAVQAFEVPFAIFRFSNSWTSFPSFIPEN